MADNTCNDPPARVRGEGMPLAPPALRSARILVADDLEANLRFLEGVLRAAGYDSVDTTQHGAEVTELYRRYRYDLVVLDLGLPDRDGYVVLAEL